MARGSEKAFILRRTCWSKRERALEVHGVPGSRRVDGAGQQHSRRRCNEDNTLLDQLVYHELPALEKALRLADPDRPSLTYAPLKGFSHYPCLRKIGHIVEEGAQTKLFGNKEQTQAPSCRLAVVYRAD